MKLFHIQLVQDGPWIKELGYSLSNVMAYISAYDAIPYAHFTTPY